MKKILIIEDNKLNLKLFYDILVYKKYEVKTAQDGLLGFEMLKKEEFDLVVLDLQLPKMDGFSIIQKLKKEKIKLPKIVVVSACAMDSDKKRALELGVNKYLTKPVDIFNFASTIENELKTS